jgi:hypothetical protein
MTGITDVIKRQSSQKQCQCDILPIGTQGMPETISHLWQVSSSEQALTESYLVCPYTGILWRRSYHEQRVTVSETLLTGCKETLYGDRSVAIARLTLYREAKSKLDFAPCIMPDLPFHGLLWVQTRANQSVEWRCGECGQSGKLALSLWIYTETPISAMGQTVQVFLASPLECITSEVLVPKHTFSLHFGVLGCEIGLLTIEEVILVDSSRFKAWFDYSHPQRNLYEEWLSKMSS